MNAKKVKHVEHRGVVNFGSWVICANCNLTKDFREKARRRCLTVDAYRAAIAQEGGEDK